MKNISITRELRHNWEIVYTIALLDLKLRYQNSKLGFLWSFLKPMLQFVTYYIVFAVILKVSDLPDYPLRLLLGVLIWAYFSESTSMGLVSYIGKKSIITKIRVRKELMPLSTGYSSALNLLLTLMVFLVVYHIWGINPLRIYHIISLGIFMLSFLTLFITSVALNILLANINALFRDVQTIWEIILIYGCFLTPIMYTLPIPKNFIPLYLFVNPLVFPLENIKYIFFENTQLYLQNPVYCLSYAASVVFIVLAAFVIDWKLKDRVADYL
jgi:ABC-type polysaccharide/polyol phosphate export permease